VRYQYRIGGDEFFDDYCFPVMVCGASYCAVAWSALFVPCICCWPCIPCCLGDIFGVYSYFVAVVMKILQESELQLKARGDGPGFYLPSSPASALNDNRAMLPSTTVYVNNDHVTLPLNAQYVPVPSTIELVDHAGGGGGGPGQNSYVPTAVAAEESSNTVTKNYV
jgi:hypothetical protein